RCPGCVPSLRNYCALSLHDALPICLGGGNAASGKEVGQINLVGAADNGLWIVHHRQPFRFCAAGEQKGVVIDVGGFPDKQHVVRSEEHTSELQSRENLVYRLLLEKK